MSGNHTISDFLECRKTRRASHDSCSQVARVQQWQLILLKCLQTSIDASYWLKSFGRCRHVYARNQGVQGTSEVQKDGIQDCSSHVWERYCQSRSQRTARCRRSKSLPSRRLSKTICDGKFQLHLITYIWHYITYHHVSPGCQVRFHSFHAKQMMPLHSNFKTTTECMLW